VPIRIAFIISAPRELTLTAGRREIAPLKSSEADEDPPFLKIGRNKSDELHLTGPLIGDTSRIADNLSIAWYFPDEEMPDEARPVNLTEVRLLISVTPRPLAEDGWRWHYHHESRMPSLSTRYYAEGYQPPFKASDLTLNLENLINFKYDGHILTGLDYCLRPPSYVESDWAMPTLEGEGFIDD
jgi:hypothetical protein